MEDFEIGVYDAGLYYSGKLKEWLEFRKKQFELYPNDIAHMYRFAEALIASNKHKEALNYLDEFHEVDPKNEDFNQQILDCLRVLNLGKSDFKWKVKPSSLSLNQQLELLIFEIFKKKRKRKLFLNDIYIEVMMVDLLEFDENGLMNYLNGSQYFKVIGIIFFDAIVERLK